ncbi:MAG: hypothetical protein ACKPKO_58165, partial [Candidatus Fonsibacter sp.]
MTVEGPGVGWPLSGNIYTDGSGVHGQHRATRRVGIAAVTLDADGGLWQRVWGPFLGAIQDVRAGEIYVGAMDLNHHDFVNEVMQTLHAYVAD